MPFVKGTPKPPGSGRVPGQVGPGKKLKAKIMLTMLTREVHEQLEALGCDPIKIMAEIASDPKEDAGVRLRAAAEVAQYVWPKRRATDHRFVDESGKDRPFLLSDADRLIAEADAEINSGE